MMGAGFFCLVFTAPHLRLAWVDPMFWIFIVAAMPLVGRRYRG
jgi:hypothetical protein